MSLQGRQIVALTYPGYQELEFWYPVLRGREEGATVRIVGPESGAAESFLGYPVVADTDVAALDPAEVDVVVVPGVTGAEPAASGAQLDLLRRAHAAGALVAATGTGAALAAGTLPDDDRVLTAPDADGLSGLFGRLRGALSTD
ncbi:DJ-1/PfpI family protein [Sphaerisporangium aureirubrum]|uniref:DJ-1/PfpI family protein n=1 Tax=Sphaerisporangium aureirubrum TaxID=1544736 RepID=A0ABW1NV06_9ACTN